MQHTITKLSTAVVYTSLATTDISRSETFYRDTLGFDVRRMPDAGDLLMVDCGAGTGIGIYARPTAPNCDTTAATFMVGDLESTMSDLRAHGVRFEEYNLPYLKTTNGVALQGKSKAAWFKDPDGNILSLVQM